MIEAQMYEMSADPDPDRAVGRSAVAPPEAGEVGPAEIDARAAGPAGGARDTNAVGRASVVGALGGTGGVDHASVVGHAGVVGHASVMPDPRQAIERLDDSVPILMMPVRLETRFAPTGELWVRIYPDDCYLDSFDPTLTESEVADARTYWLAMWQAGGFEEQERAAWRRLVDAHGSGRGRWVADACQPVNQADRPTKADPADIVLTVVTDAALPDTEASPLAAYWTGVFAAGDAVAVETARATLASVVGSDRAAELIAAYRPSNMATEPPPGVAPEAVTVRVAYLVFPSPETKEHGWSRPSRIWLLPQRFVFIGYRRGAAPLVVLGNPVPPELHASPDPAATGADQLRQDEHGDLVLPDRLRWIADFDRAVEIGMGMRITLTADQARDGFDRVLVLGVRLGSDPDAVRADLQQLLDHHAHSRTGLALVPQGTPTNNTEAVGSGHSRLDDADASFDARARPGYELTADWAAKRDGQWLAEYLGLAPDFFVHTEGGGVADQLTERAMTAVLWPATLGYWMQTMMAPVFGDDVVGHTRDFAHRYLLGAGAIPALRIGRQPYGVVPATALSRMAWLEQPRGDNRLAALAHRAGGDYLAQLYRVLRAIQQDWAALVSQIAHIGAEPPAGDPHQALLDVVGLHPGSLEWSQRYAENLATLFNRLNLGRVGGLVAKIVLAAERANATALLARLGYSGQAAPAILDHVFASRHNLLTGGVVDDRPLSETAAIREYTEDHRNYLRWLIDAARAGLDQLYRQDGFTGDRPPSALLYLMVRHALQLSYHEVSLRLYVDRGLYTAEQARAARIDDPFLHIRDVATPSESRYQPLLATAAQITGDASMRVSDFIAAGLGTLAASTELAGQLDALALLENRPTAALERAFADHIDCCSYRLDAWLLGLVHHQLALMRGLAGDKPARTGIYLGAYAWLEGLRPQHRVVTPYRPSDPELARDFVVYPDGTHRVGLTVDSTNQGYVHAPSLNHAVTAAVLRNAHLSAPDPAQRERFAVNLTSERVRVALAMLEGIRAGQSLADLLGYQFERGLHDRYGLAEVDRFIYPLRKAFPLRSDRMASTRSDPGVPIEAIEARNVIDGLALVEHMLASKVTAYPFGKAGLPTASPTEAAAITAEARRLLDIQDAVADLALAEGVHQAVLGNYDRVASTYDAYARGAFPPEPEIVRTPLSGLSLTSRVALHLPGGTGSSTSPIAALAMTPRAQADPAVNTWLAGVLPSLDQVGCLVSFRAADTGTEATREVTLRQLELQPADVVTILRPDAEQAMSEVDDRVVQYVRAHANPRPDVAVTIQYLATQTAPVSVFEALPLLRAARRLLTASRPLTASDLTLTNQARAQHDEAPMFDRERVDLVRNGMVGVRGELIALRDQLAGVLGDVIGRREELLSNVDSYVDQLAAALSRAAAFGLPQSGWGFGYDAQGRGFAGILRACAELVDRWDGRLTEFADAITRYAGLPASMSDEERMRILTQAERAITTQPLTPRPATPAAFAAALQGTPLAQFRAKRDQFAAVAATTRRTVAQLRADVLALLPVSGFDAIGIDLGPVEEGLITFVDDARTVLDVLTAELDRRLVSADQRLAEYEARAAARDRVAALRAGAKALLGDDCLAVPEFIVDPTVSAEVTAALVVSGSGELMNHLTHPADPGAPPVDFPVDTWLHGVARVRDKLHAWEELQLMSGALTSAEPQLQALQLPADAGIGWFGLELPPGQLPDSERLLYTAHFATPFDPAGRVCGLLVDEWTEVIPAGAAETGLAFHYDRPNTEAPQSMLLVTPAQVRGSWRWQDVVDALNETLDLAKLRAIEPRHIDQLPYAPFLPATMMATQVHQLTIATDLSFNNARRRSPEG